VWRRILPAALFSLIIFAPAASAQDLFAPRLSFDGFGTVGLVYSTEDQADFVESTMRAEGAGYSAPVDASVDSRIAGQLTLDLGERVTAVLQLIAEQTASGNYTPSAEWANLRYSFTPDFSVRGGRIVLPAFLVSDSRKVSYANPWVRPPVEVYGMVPIYSWDGVDASYQRRLGEWTSGVNAGFGRSETDTPDGSIDAERVWTVSSTLHRGNLTGRVGITGAAVTVDDMAPLFEGFRAFGPEGEAIADRFEVDDTPFRFVTTAVEYDPGTWFTIVEGGWMNSRSAVGERLAGYITGGYRWGVVTPYATFARTKALSETSVAGLSLTGLPAEYAQAAAQLNAGLNSILANSPVQQNLAIGGRWDFMPGVALKAQIDFIDQLGESSGTFINFQPNFAPGGSSQVLSVATAFVF
jgi:hypothetical protein